MDNPEYDPAKDSLYSNLTKRYSGIENIIGNNNILIRNRRYIIEMDTLHEIDGIGSVIDNPKILNRYSFGVDFLGENDIGWQEYCDDIRGALRDKNDIVSENGTFGVVPVAYSFRSSTKFGRDAMYVSVYDV